MLIGMILAYMKRRPADAHLSWGEAMLGAMFVFLLLFWVYGVVPHQWLTWADNELNWRSDKLFVGLGAIFEAQEYGGSIPFTITYVAIRDVIAVAIYGIAIGGNIALWMMWQNRGKAKRRTEELSSFGRPLIREGTEVKKD
ncbi:MAG: hypothetical protein OXI96_00125 [Acidimicrobiaceae bacterium]|nr:hypothetical protein [Acidimicrobiaceae bacterium]